MQKSDFDIYLKKAADLYDLEKKILDLSNDFELHVFINLIVEFYAGVEEIRNAFIETSALPIELTELEGVDEDKVEFMQAILNNDLFEEIEKKKTKIYFRILLEFGTNKKERESFDEWINRAHEELDEKGRELMNMFNTIGSIDFNAEDELTINHLYEWFGPYKYIEDLRNAGAILVKSDKLPDNFSSVVYTVKQCYAFQQYLAVIVLCRTALEVALRDIYVKLGFSKKGSPTNSIAYNYFFEKRKEKKRKYTNEYDPSPEDLRNLICRLPEYEEFEDHLRDLYSDLSRVIHGSTDFANRKHRSEEFMKETIWLIYDLYNKSQV